MAFWGPGTWNLKPTWELEPGTWNLEPRTWNLEPGTWLPPRAGLRAGLFNTEVCSTKWLQNATWHWKWTRWSLEPSVPRPGCFLDRQNKGLLFPRIDRIKDYSFLGST